MLNEEDNSESDCGWVDHSQTQHRYREVQQGLVSILAMSKSLFFQQSPLLRSSFIAFLISPPPLRRHPPPDTYFAYDHNIIYNLISIVDNEFTVKYHY